ncbi:uncharacterized protein LOC134770085 [Penaeus indicus]|uniref:uncharacterized protein LOC134770085 n=1 Tax=Penaeus indicus TaxID=29960 RepID=UPI00300D2D8E
MTNPLTCLLVLVLLSVTSVDGEQNGLQETGRTILSPDEAAGMHVVVSQFFSGGGLLLACFYVLLHLFKPLYTLFTEPPAEGADHGADAHGGGHRSLLNSSSINGLEKYKEAQRLGATFDDCQLHFQCSRLPLGFS